MPKNRRFLRRAAALILAVLLLAAAMPSALATDTRTGTVSAPTGILLLLASPGGEAAGEVPDGSAVFFAETVPNIGVGIGFQFLLKGEKRRVVAGILKLLQGSMRG